MAHKSDETQVKHALYLFSALETAKTNRIGGKRFHTEKYAQGTTESEDGSNDTTSLGFVPYLENKLQLALLELWTF